MFPINRTEIFQAGQSSSVSSVRSGEKKSLCHLALKFVAMTSPKFVFHLTCLFLWIAGELNLLIQVFMFCLAAPQTDVSDVMTILNSFTKK